ncbi:hypothetical protein IHQ68_04810 [Chelatococcus sambhunathii]|uniref:Uncharacterized protein n=1 Tax=Chelatococcus sambhunathii TaxID=363953 RepID=A0ABU1DDD0_9HYPH|nr:hypothetical protein [Chelatococcus sambhunathii]MDR4305945.1 hypothetical protein [Chelatococcus sambhunathii]
MECVALIGHECADKVKSIAAEKAWAREQAERTQQDFLLEHLPRVPAMLTALEELRAVAVIAVDLYRHFRKKAGSVHRDLRHIASTGAQLTVAEKVWDELYGTGPTAFRGSSGQTRSVSFGVLRGTTAVKANFDPTRDIDLARSRIQPLRCEATDDAVLDFILSLDDKGREMAVGFIREAERTFEKALAAIKDFRNFFEADNLKRIDAWGAHEDAFNPVKIEDRRFLGKREVYITGSGSAALLTPDPVLWSFQVRWPS